MPLGLDISHVTSKKVQALEIQVLVRIWFNIFLGSEIDLCDTLVQRLYQV